MLFSTLISEKERKMNIRSKKGNVAFQEPMVTLKIRLYLSFYVFLCAYVILHANYFNVIKHGIRPT